MFIKGVNNNTIYKLIPHTLTGPTKFWFRSLKACSVPSLEQLLSKFIYKVHCAFSLNQVASKLAFIKQGETEFLVIMQAVFIKSCYGPIGLDTNIYWLISSKNFDGESYGSLSKSNACFHIVKLALELYSRLRWKRNATWNGKMIKRWSCTARRNLIGLRCYMIGHPRCKAYRIW